MNFYFWNRKFMSLSNATFIYFLPEIRYENRNFIFRVPINPIFLSHGLTFHYSRNMFSFSFFERGKQCFPPTSFFFTVFLAFSFRGLKNDWISLIRRGRLTRSWTGRAGGFYIFQFSKEKWKKKKKRVQSFGPTTFAHLDFHGEKNSENNK